MDKDDIISNTERVEARKTRVALRRTRFFIAVFAVLLLSAEVTLWWMQKTEMARQKKAAEAAELRAKVAESQTFQSRQRAEWLVNFMIEQLDPLGRPDLADEINRRLRAYFEAALDPPHLLRERYAHYVTRAMKLEKGGDVQGALVVCENALAALEKFVASDPKNSVCEYDLCMGYEDLGDRHAGYENWTQAARAYGRAVEIARPRFVRADPDVRWNNLFAHGALRRWEVALRHAPVGTVKFDRAAALADLRAAQEVFVKLKDLDPLRLGMINQNILPRIERLLREAEKPAAAEAEKNPK